MIDTRSIHRLLISPYLFACQPTDPVYSTNAFVVTTTVIASAITTRNCVVSDIAVTYRS